MKQLLKRTSRDCSVIILYFSNCNYSVEEVSSAHYEANAVLVSMNFICKSSDNISHRCIVHCIYIYFILSQNCSKLFGIPYIFIQCVFLSSYNYNPQCRTIWPMKRGFQDISFKPRFSRFHQKTIGITSIPPKNSLH